MRNASGHQGENERHWKSSKVNRNTYNISSQKRVTKGSFLKFYVVLLGKDLIWILIILLSYSIRETFVF